MSLRLGDIAPNFSADTTEGNIDSLQLTARHKVATPADWKNGEECIITLAVKDEEVPAFFPQGMKKVKPYLRYTPQPRD